MSTTIISCCDPPPIFEPTEHNFDLIALFIHGCAIARRRFATLTRRNTRGYAFGRESLAIGITVIALVTYQYSGSFWQSWIKYPRPNVVTGLACRQTHHERTSVFVDNCREFGVQPAFGTSDMAGNIPFSSRLEAVRWALRCVASIMSVSDGAPDMAK